MPEAITIVLAKRTLQVYALLLTQRQEANDVNNEWGIARILVLNTATPTVPPAPTEIAAMVLASEFKGIYRAGGIMGGGV